MKVIDLENSEDLKEYIEKYEYTILKFSAVWCGPCKQISIELNNKLKNYNSNNVIILNVDYDLHEDLSEKFNITKLPTLIIYKSKKIVNIITGTNLDILYNTLSIV